MFGAWELDRVTLGKEDPEVKRLIDISLFSFRNYCMCIYCIVFAKFTRNIMRKGMTQL